MTTLENPTLRSLSEWLTSLEGFPDTPVFFVEKNTQEEKDLREWIREFKKEYPEVEIVIVFTSTNYEEYRRYKRSRNRL